MYAIRESRNHDLVMQRYNTFFIQRKNTCYNHRKWRKKNLSYLTPAEITETAEGFCLTRMERIERIEGFLNPYCQQ